MEIIKETIELITPQILLFIETVFFLVTLYSWFVQYLQLRKKEKELRVLTSDRDKLANLVKSMSDKNYKLNEQLENYKKQNLTIS